VFGYEQRRLLPPIEQPTSEDDQVVRRVLRRADGDRKIQGYLLGPTRRIADVWSAFAGYSPGDLNSSYRVPVRRTRGSTGGAGTESTTDFESVPMHDPDSPLPHLRPGTMFLYKGNGVLLANVNIAIESRGEARFIGVVFV
jgi:hypothetical protein